MTLTPEQFNKLATKKDLEELKDELVTKTEFKEAMDNISSSLDSVVKKLDTIEHAFVSNQAAHDRFEQRILRIEQHLGFTTLVSAK